MVTHSKASFAKLVKSSVERVLSWTARRANWLALVGGSGVVAAWTVLRHITNGVNFDVVGQIGLSQQWVQGWHDGAQLGATNYLIKFPLYMLVNVCTWMSPMNRLLILALICNLLTFWFIFYLFNKIFELYGVRSRTTLLLGLAWLSTTAGALLWADYANSRNLELVGGVLYIYLILGYIRRPRVGSLAPILLVGTVVFFADPLQMYVCGTSAIAFVCCRLIRHRTRAAAIAAVGIIMSTLLAVLGSAIVKVAAERLLHISFLVAPKAPLSFNSSASLTAFKAAFENILRIFDADVLRGGHGLNGIRVALNALVLLFIIGILLRHFPRKRARTPAVLAGVIVFINLIVYVASGQAGLSGTYRYLALLPIFTVLIIGLWGGQISRRPLRLGVHLGWLAITLISGTLLIGALATSWPTRHQKDVHILNLVSQLHSKNYGYAVGSREIGITTSYFSQGKTTVLPMACSSDHRLQPDFLFYDRAALTGLNNYVGDVPVIIQNDQIQFGAAVCSVDNIKAQFGPPKSQLSLPGTGSALIYDAHSLQFKESGAWPRKPHLSGSPTLTSGDLPHFGPRVINLDRLQNCPNGTVDVLIAHPDDDILFMNPAIADGIKETCHRIIYVTAADDGKPSQYWSGRERGIQAAYAQMLGVPDVWASQASQVAGHTVLAHSLRGVPTVGLIFMHLPDGNVDGQGFKSSGGQSIEKLAGNQQSFITPIDGSPSYTYQELLGAIGDIFKYDAPTSIFTHVTDGPKSIGDHSDHRAVGRIAVLSRRLAGLKTPVKMFVGYPLNGLPANLAVDVARLKRATFTVYAYDDTEICNSRGTCDIENTYGRYFARSYELDLGL